MKSLFLNIGGFGFRRARLVAAVLGLMVAGSVFLLYQIRGNVAVLTIDSMPGSRLANNLIEQAAVCEIARLRAALHLADAPVPSALSDGLRAMFATLEEYRQSVYSDFDQRNWESAHAAFKRYAAGALLQAKADPAMERAYEDMRTAYLVLRDYNRERSRDLVDGSARHISTAIRWNLGFLFALAVFLAATAVYFSIRSVRDIAPDDF